MRTLSNILIAIFLVAFAASLYLNVRHYYDGRYAAIPCDTARVTIIDTMTIYKPVPRDSVVVRYVASKLPVRRDTIIVYQHDSIEVEVPITQKVYSDSLYTAYVSGYLPSLDSLTLRSKTEVVTITKVIRQSDKRWGISLQAGYGVSLKGTPQVAPYIGVGLSYNLFRF